MSFPWRAVCAIRLQPNRWGLIDAYDYNKICGKLSKDLRINAKEVKQKVRIVRYHDIQTCRDIIVGIDRFFEATYKRGGSGLGTIDLMLLSTAKYLMDYYGFTRTDLFIITLDKDLYKIAKSMNDIPKAFNPQEKRDNYKKVFVVESKEKNK